MIARYSGSVLLAVLLIVGVAGCPGTDEIGKTVPVTGKVTVDDRPLDGGSVACFPDEQKGNKTKVSVSGIIKGGEYTLESDTPTGRRKGAPPGWYKVTISTMAAMTGTGTPVTKDAKSDAKLQPPAPKGGAPIAEKYTNPQTTPLEIEVKSGGNFDLKATSK